MRVLETRAFGRLGSNPRSDTNGPYAEANEAVDCKPTLSRRESDTALQFFDNLMQRVRVKGSPPVLKTGAPRKGWLFDSATRCQFFGEMSEWLKLAHC